jgi:Tol biopolymer transport system component
MSFGVRSSGSGAQARRRNVLTVLTLLAVVLCLSSITRSDAATSDPTLTAGTTQPSSPPLTIGDLTDRLAISVDAGIALTDASFGQVHQLTHDGGFDPSWSPDGSSIAYRLLLADDDGEIWVVDVATGDAHDLVNDPVSSDWGPDWSPDGGRIAYSSNRGVGGISVFVMDADGSAQHAVSPGHGEYPAWAPDGQSIAYAGGPYYDIRIVNADGTNDREVTTGPAYDMYPAWSPDGEWIAYETQADYYPALTEPGMGPELEIHVVRPDGTDDRRVTNDHVEDYFPTWTPDGRFLTWVRHGRIVAARPDGTGMVELGNGNFPDWSAS